MKEFILRAAQRHRNLVIWVACLGLNLLLALGTSSVTSAQESSAYLRLVRVIDTGTSGVAKPVGLAFSPATEVFLLSQAREPDQRDFKIAMISYFDDPIGSVTVPQDGVQLRGLAFDPKTNHRHALDLATRTLYELNEAGQIVATRDLSFLELRDPQGMVFAPSGDLTDDPALMSLYIVESGSRNSNQGHGRIVELSLNAPFQRNFSDATNVRASLVNMIATSAWSPPSPDPMGMAYISSSGRLMVSDSEVEESPFFQGANVFESTLPGELSGTFNATPVSREPSGIAFNPDNRHLFIADDDADKIFEIDPGIDGEFFTTDDIRTSFSTRAINNMDPEGIAYDIWQGHLFIVDGFNAEVYEIKPGLNGIFDGQPPLGDDQMAQFDTTPFDILDPEGIEFNPDNGHLYITGPGQKKVMETTTTGTLISVIDLTSTKAQKISGLAYAPGSMNPEVMNLYVSARGVDNNADSLENDGRIYEVSFPSLSINGVSVIEGNAGTVDLVFTVNLESANREVVTVDYATTDGSATAGSDYVATSGTLTFPRGTRTQTIVVAVNGDALNETDEVFLVDLSNPASATIAHNQGQGMITDDDSSPSIFIDDVTVTEGDSGTVKAVFTVTLSSVSGRNVTVDYTTADGTATAGSDYVAVSGTLIFPPGTTTQTIAVSVNGDALNEPDEVFLVNLSNPSNVLIADREGQGTINDDDYPPPIIASFSPTHGSAGTEVTITGSNFIGVISANFNQTAASTFMVDSPEQVRATIPPLATTGKISLTTLRGTATSEDDFDVSLPTTISLNPTGETKAPTVSALYANVPNPFNPSTTINYDLAAMSEVTVMIFDILGKPVRTLVSERQPAGRYAVRWDGRDSHGEHVSSGVFFCQLRVAAHQGEGGTRGLVQSRKMLLLQ